MQNLVIEVSGGIVQAVYSDTLPDYDTSVTVIDHDNIESGGEHPLPNFNPKDYNVLY